MAGGIISNLMYAIGFKFNDRGIADAESGVNDLTKSVVALGVAGGAAMVGLGAAALSAATDFEEAMSNVRLTTGQTEEQMEETREIAKSLYNQNFGEDWADLGASISAVAKATQLTGDALETASSEAMRYSKQFDGDVAESIAAVSVAMENFGVTSTEAFNLLTQGQHLGVDGQGDMLDSINEYSQAFASVGFDMEDTLAYMQNGMRAGARSTDLLGDAMNEFSILSIEVGGTAAESFKMLGLDAEKMTSTFAAGGPNARKAFGDIVSMISDIKDPVQQNIIGIGLFGTMFEELGVKAFSALDDVNSNFDKSKGSVAELGNSFNSIGDSFQYFKRHIETGILIPIGQKLLPYLNKFGAWLASHQPQIEAVGNAIAENLGFALDLAGQGVKFLYDKVVEIVPKIIDFKDRAVGAFESFKSILEENKTTILSVAGVIATLFLPALIQTGVQATISGFKMLGSFLASIVTSGAASASTAAIMTGKLIMSIVQYAAAGWKAVYSITATTAAFLLQKTIMGVSAVATWAMTAAQWALNSAFLANPITWIVIGIIAVIVAVILVFKNWGKIGPWLLDIWNRFKAGMMKVFKTIWTGIKNVFTAIVNFFKRWGVTILVVLGGPIVWVVALVIKYWDKIKSVTMTVFTAIWNWLKSVWTSISTTVSNVASRIWGAITKAWDNIKTAIRNAMETVKETMSGAWESVVSAVSGVGERIKETLSGAWGAVKTAFADAINWIIDKFNSMIEKMNSLSITNPFNGETIGVNIPTIPRINGSHEDGLANVPFDGYIAELHEDERVLTAAENKAYTPESAPARTVRNSKHEISLKVGFSGAAANMSGADETRMRQMLSEVFESAIRRMGLEGTT
ncbi:hypothetical protein PAECIP111893_00263 [Paenibacillus plantiphilus]|uniref:Phage tail tape measure protein domain-containing protein n=1 Tax=Paenibacillus plantiphilus TaxID=2905650 RepID=A0ABN8FX70_9BACL|nr:phage tail tape measure protein [Paenibacillus plantiphilus]CAH1190298.1 hypothetical protein PAECIP111893_00263 [Paenibacillus plantiphilus]